MKNILATAVFRGGDVIYARVTFIYTMNNEIILEHIVLRIVFYLTPSLFSKANQNLPFYNSTRKNATLFIC